MPCPNGKLDDSWQEIYLHHRKSERLRQKSLGLLWMASHSISTHGQAHDVNSLRVDLILILGNECIQCVESHFHRIRNLGHSVTEQIPTNADPARAFGDLSGENVGLPFASDRFFSGQPVLQHPITVPCYRFLFHRLRERTQGVLSPFNRRGKPFDRETFAFITSQILASYGASNSS